LWLSRNAIKAIPAGLFDELANLELLLIDHNQLEVIHPDTFQQTKKLKELYLQANKIQVIDKGTFNGLGELKYLNLKDNSYIDREYGDYRNPTAPIDLKQVSSDCGKTVAKASLQATITTTDTATPQKTSWKFSNLALIIASISLLLLIVGILVIITFDRESKKIFGPNIRSHIFPLKNRESSVYYSTPD
jgi:hypothetical protein